LANQDAAILELQGETKVILNQVDEEADESLEGDDSEEDPDEYSECIPRVFRTGEDIFFRGKCKIPIFRLGYITVSNEPRCHKSGRKVQIDEQASLGQGEPELLDVMQCNICDLSSTSCIDICKDNIAVAENLFDRSMGTVGSNFCFDLSYVGDFIKYLIGGDKCFYGLNTEI